MTRDLYDKMSSVHTKEDVEVMWDVLEENQKEVRCHGRAIMKIFRIGSNEGSRNKNRCHQNISSLAKDTPTMRATAKTHKPPGGFPSLSPLLELVRDSQPY